MKTKLIRTPADLVAFSVTILLAAAILFPTLIRMRAGARSAACASNLRTLGLAVHNYHSAYRRLPSAASGTTAGEAPASNNAGQLNGFVALLPFMEHSELWEEIANPYVSADGKKFNAMGPVPWYDAKQYEPWGKAPAELMCPDRVQKAPQTGPPEIVYSLKTTSIALGVTSSYAFNYGDLSADAGENPHVTKSDTATKGRSTARGLFSPSNYFKFRDVLDGLSNTLMFGEVNASVAGKSRATSGIAKDVVGLRDDPSRCQTAAAQASTKWWGYGRGSRWCYGDLTVTGFQTILPPNAASCTSDQGRQDAIVSSSSLHQDGVHAVFADGRVCFISNNIDCGDSSAANYGPMARGRESPYGLWGALGTRAARERFESIAPSIQDVDRRKERQDSAVFQSWIGKDGTKLSAEFVRVIDQKTLEVRDFAGVLHRVPLSSLQSESIYMAVELDFIRSSQ